MNLTDRLPPQNMEAEQGVIGSVILSNDMMHEVGTIIVADDFYRASHAILWQMIAYLYREGKRFDAVILAAELNRLGKLAEIGGEDYLCEVIQSVPNAAHAVEYAHYVRQKSIARRLLEMHETSIREIYSNQFTAEQLVDNVQKTILEVIDHAAKAKSELKTLKDAMDDARKVLESKREGAVMGVASGLPELDKLVTFTPGSFTVIGGRPGTGKSALALQIALHAATTLDVPVLLMSMEMIAAELGERAFSILGCAGGYQMRHPKELGDDEFVRLLGQISRGYDAGKNAPIYIDDTSGRTSMQVISVARRSRIRHQVGLVVVDYLQLCEADDDRDNRQEQVSKISRRMKVLARTLEIPVIALSQLNRQCEARDDRRPRKSDLRESGSLEQDADNVLLMFCPDERPDEAEIIVDKSRSGPVGFVRAFFHRNLVRFETWVPPAVQEGTF